jgi:HPt (histidine-containing phosphotransfer) domain-containing protein
MSEATNNSACNSSNADLTYQSELPVVDVLGLRATLGEINLSPLFAIFIEDAVIELKKMDAARQSRDSDQFLMLVHGLKGACATMYAMRMKYICVKLEGACRGGEWDKVDQIFSALESALASVQMTQV